MNAYAALVTEPINVNALLQRVADRGTGAVTLFLGTVRNVNDGRTVTGIDYEAYGAMALSELEAIAHELVNAVPDLRLAVEHRVGMLSVGDVSVAIAAAHAHRAQAMDASRTVIEAIKQRVPIWKREHYTEGDWHWVDPTAKSTNAKTADALAQATS
ncbi:MAG: molybdenum cofactor biosynthesis protein MoaE [Gemmatimonadaceae bacterium]